MENLGEVLRLSLRLRASLESGESVRIFLYNYIQKTQNDFAGKLKRVFAYIEQSGKFDLLLQNDFSPTTRLLLEIIFDGLQGHSIYERLSSYETELLDQIENEIQKKIDALPYFLMIPLLLLMFPAYLLLILGPILSSFLKNF